ncbi:YqjF family protein [Tuberibacillus sp. Marseille-P3662]|uniref:YqjF family protein n=1 Tax=Tuberibacillus sp. Marseille-P3662 TaxID=1965358 RepID=UPI000A1CB446|nr:DUF2071 domain-containing protein [Tuberibacillus sp. Marseille-P3662]
MGLDTTHRPWPLPNQPWIMKQTWHDLLFAHWPVDPDMLGRFLPNSLPLDTYKGDAWISLVALSMSGVRPRGIPPVPFMSRFPELNVRTYVTVDGKPGVYFFSLDAASWMAVKLAGIAYHLPYFHARMNVTSESGKVSYTSKRYNGQRDFRCQYQAISEPYQAEKGTLDYWLAERYCLYTVHNQRVYRCNIHHQPWLLQKAEAHIEKNTMIDRRIQIKEDPAPLLRFSKQKDVRIWPLEKMR